MSSPVTGQTDGRLDGPRSSLLEAGRVALGEQLLARAAEVAEAVVAAILPGHPSEPDGTPIGERIRHECIGTTRQLGSWLCTGRVASKNERLDVTAHSRDLVAGTMSMADLTKAYLIWRDTVLAVVEQEDRRLGLDDLTVATAQAAIRHGCDATLVTMIKQFDAGRVQLQEQLAAEHAKLTHLALHDPLTGLANRALLIDRLGHALHRARRESGTTGLLYLDLDGFKAINDRHGHHIGDRVLIEVGARLTGVVRPSDTVARLGGDEFVICCEQITGGQSELAAIAGRIRAVVTEPLEACPDQRVSVSVGTVLAARGSDTDAMLRAADAAMYAAKQAGSRHVASSDVPDGSGGRAEHPAALPAPRDQRGDDQPDATVVTP